MELAQIKLDMLVFHVTNPKVTMVINWYNQSNGRLDQDCVQCEWMNEKGEFMSKNFKPKFLNPVLTLE